MVLHSLPTLALFAFLLGVKWICIYIYIAFSCSAQGVVYINDVHLCLDYFRVHIMVLLSCADRLTHFFLN